LCILSLIFGMKRLMVVFRDVLAMNQAFVHNYVLQTIKILVLLVATVLIAMIVIQYLMTICAPKCNG
jgi:hypothetical protein